MKVILKKNIDRNYKGEDFRYDSPDFIAPEIEHDVYGIEISDGKTFIYIAERESSYFPSIYLLDYFEITSPELSKYWQISSSGGKVQILFADWIKQPDFYSQFINDLQPESTLYLTLKSFEYYRGLIKEESKEQ